MAITLQNELVYSHRDSVGVAVSDSSNIPYPALAHLFLARYSLPAVCSHLLLSWA